MSNAREPVNVIGAGLVGSLLAIYLARRGLAVRVWEARPDLRRAAIPAGRSINLALANRGLRALERVGLAGPVQSLLTPMRGRMLHEGDGGLSFQLYGQDPSEIIYSVSRGALNALLLDTAEQQPGVELHFETPCIDADFAAGTLAFGDTANGTQETAAMSPAIAADGAGSVIRHAMAELDGRQVEEDWLAHGYKELTIPPGPDASHRIEREALHIWPRGGHMLIALPNLDGSFTVTLFLANEGQVSFAALDDERAVEAFFTAQFPDVVPLIPELTQDFFRNPTGSLATVRCWPWRVGGQALLLGDAAHAIVPFHGQGMNCGFEDCHALDRCIDRHGNDWERVFAGFETMRKPDADAIADMALDNYIEMRDTVLDPRFHLKKAVAWELETRFSDRFVPRYSMVMFHHIPYAEARRRGAIQQTIIDTLLEQLDDPSEVDYRHAAEMIETRLEPIPAELLERSAIESQA